MIVEDIPSNNELPEISEDDFRALAIKGLGNELAEKWIEELWDEKVYNNEMTPAEALQKLKQLIEKRRDVKTRVSTEFKSADHETEKYLSEERARVIESIIRSQSMPDNFLGNGAVAEVYSIADAKGICAKIIMNQQRYNEGNNVRQEARFLDELKDFTVNGVRTPHLKEVISTIDLTAITMEELDAANFRRVLEGKDELPETFNLDEYFNDLKQWLLEAHRQGVYHGDFYLRNVMIDRATGKPRVIDFGKAKFRREMVGENFETEEDIIVKKDLAGLTAAKAEVREWLSSRKPLKPATLDKSS